MMYDVMGQLCTVMKISPFEIFHLAPIWRPFATTQDDLELIATH